MALALPFHLQQVRGPYAPFLTKTERLWQFSKQLIGHAKIVERQSFSFTITALVGIRRRLLMIDARLNGKI